MLKCRIITMIIVLTMILSLFSFTLHAEDVEDKDIQILQDIRMLRGPENGVTEEYLKTNVKRWQVAIMLVRLTGNEPLIANYAGKGNFVDADLVNSEVVKYLSFIFDHPELGMIGIGNNKFDPNSNITAKDYYKVMLHVLGYIPSTDVIIGDYVYEDTLQYAESIGLSKVALADPFTVRDMAIATAETLKTSPKGCASSLALMLVEKGIIDKHLINRY